MEKNTSPNSGYAIELSTESSSTALPTLGQQQPLNAEDLTRSIPALPDIYNNLQSHQHNHYPRHQQHMPTMPNLSIAGVTGGSTSRKRKCSRPDQSPSTIIKPDPGINILTMW